MIVFIVLAVLLLLILILNVKIVPQSKSYVIERLGRYNSTWETGLHIKIPILDRISKKFL